MNPRRYTSPESFKQALEQRLRLSTPSGAEFARKRQLLVFDRFLARVIDVFGDALTLKGGLVLEFRVERARTTRDVDLRLVGSPTDLLLRLQAAGRLDLSDFMSFEIEPDKDHPEIQSEGMQYDGLRFRAECKLAGRIYGQAFGVDVAFGEPIFGEPERITSDDILGFAGIAPPIIRIFPIETHIAEKLHAYTIPRARLNSRVKDLPDIALLASTQPLEIERVRAALNQTFSFRNTHPVPATFPPPPETWRVPYDAMVRQDRLRWKTLEDVTAAAKAFIEPVLGDMPRAHWSPVDWRWTSSPDES